MDDKKEQFSLIYNEYIEKIYRFVYLKVNSQEIAEDITSKVFMKGWKTYNKQDIGNMGAFLYQIARNNVTDFYRKKDRTTVISAENIPYIIDQKVNLHEKAAIDSDMEAVQSALRKLKQEHQDVLIWYYLDDLPPTQIAQLINKPVGTVRVMIHRGLQSLKDEIRGQA